MIMDIYKANEIINSILENRTMFDIVKDFKSIKNLALSIIKDIAEFSDIENKEEFVENMLPKVVIKGLSLAEIEKKYIEKYNYEKLCDALNNVKLFPKKNVKIILHGQEIDLDVFDTGFEYIPTDTILYNEEIITKLKELKEKEKLEQLADILENGVHSIYLDKETKDKINKYLEDKKLKDFKIPAFLNNKINLNNLSDEEQFEIPNILSEKINLSELPDPFIWNTNKGEEEYNSQIRQR